MRIALFGSGPSQPRGFHLLGRIRELSFHHHQIDLLHAPLGKLVLAQAGRDLGLGHQHDAGGLPVQPVDEPRAGKSVMFLEQSPEGVGEEAAAGMAGQGGGLVDHQQVVILMQDGIAGINRGLHQGVHQVNEPVARGQDGITPRLAIVEQEAAGRQLRLPFLPAEVGEALADEIQELPARLLGLDEHRGFSLHHCPAMCDKPLV